MKNNYAFQGYESATMARGIGKDLPISTKQSVMVCNAMRDRNVSKVKLMLKNVILLKQAIPFTRFNRDLGHKAKMGPGSYPVSVCTEVLALLKSVEANAKVKGLNTSALVITHCCAHKGAGQWHYGRFRGRQMKRTHFEIVVSEKKTADALEQKAPRKVAKKAEAKPAQH